MDSNDARFFLCNGWWEQQGYGRQPMENLRISFDAGRAKGSGIDIVGPFSITGTIEEHGSVAILKQYLGRHSVDYLGLYDGEGTMTGEWHLSVFRGRWAISIRRNETERTSEIAEYVPNRGIVDPIPAPKP